MNQMNQMIRSREVVRLICVSLACFCLLAIPARNAAAQVDEGSITGIVTDSTGAAVPNAAVTLVNTDIGLSLQSITNGTGQYTFSPVRIGHYKVTVGAPGFSKTTQENITVNIGGHAEVDVLLKTGAVDQTVEVTAAPPALQIDESSVGQVMTEKSINDLPLNGRNFTFLAQLGAGTQSPQADTRGNANSGAFSANGLRPAQNNYLLDGIDNNSNAVDFLNGTNFIVLPPLDAIAEFKVQTADFSAELGRSAGAVLNATIKSGSNDLHGSVWEFFRNDVLDARDFFEPTSQKKAAFRQNQFGASIGGRIIKDKLFFFGDYEGLRRVQGQTSTAQVPTLNEVNSGFSNLADILIGQGGASPQTDLVGRTIPLGTVLDPATTRQVTAGQVDPVSGLQANQSGYVRDPFGTCPAAGITSGGVNNTFTLAGCNLNQIPAGRLDPTALKVLSLYPKPTNALYANNYVSSPDLYEHRDAFDIRVDYDPNQKDQVFARFSYVDDPQYIPGVFGGIADGGAFQQGTQTAHSSQTVVGYTHVFTPSTINVAHVGFNHLHTTRFGPEGAVSGIPASYGIQGIPDFAENGGLPEITFGGLSTLGTNAYLPSDETSQTLQITDDFTKIYKTHSFKAGIETQFVKNDVLQPPYSHGDFDFNGTYTDVPAKNSNSTGLAQFLITPEATTVPNGFSYSGGADAVNASNASKTEDYRTYIAGYLQDDWKATPKLTFNLGVRYDYFSPIRETNGGQANFVPDGPPNGVPTFLIPASGKEDAPIASTYTAFYNLLVKDGITPEQTDKYGQGLVQTQKANFAPRIGLAYQASNKLVVRAGFGYFYNSFENQGYSPNIGENYPFQFQFNYTGQTAGTNPGEQGVSPISYNTPYASCATAGPGGTATIGSGLSCYSFNPALVNPEGLALEGLQFKYQTPRTLSTNLTMEYALTRSMTATVSYVFTQAQHLQIGPGSNNVTAILPETANTKNTASPGLGGTIPFPDFAANASYEKTAGNSNYNSLQTKIEQRYTNGLSFLFAYTYSKTLTDAIDLLNSGSLSGSYRAPAVPGLGPSFDYGPAAFDVRQVLHLSGGYDLPLGTGKRFMGSANKRMNYVIGGWSTNYILTLQGGQPITLSCPSPTTAGTNCNDIRVPGQNPDLGIHLTASGPRWFNNPAAFQQACPLGAAATTGCIPVTGSNLLGDAPGTTVGPGFHRLDFSLFKDFKFSDRFRAQFRTEVFNIVNHPNFGAPGFGGNGVVAISGSGNFTNSNFGLIGSTRDDPNDPRQIQFAFKLYY